MRSLLYMMNMMIALVLFAASPFTRLLTNHALVNGANSLNVRNIATQCLEIYRYNPSQAEGCKDIKGRISEFENYQELPPNKKNNDDLSRFYREL